MVKYNGYETVSKSAAAVVKVAQTKSREGGGLGGRWQGGESDVYIAE